MTPAQRKAIDLAKPSGYLRRLPGGYWVGSETKWRGNDGAVHAPADQWVGTATVQACEVRGWFEVAGPLTRLTEEGRNANRG